MNVALEILKVEVGTQEEIAARFNVSQPAIAKWFKRDMVPHDKILDVAPVVGMTAEEILKENLKKAG